MVGVLANQNTRLFVCDCAKASLGASSMDWEIVDAMDLRPLQELKAQGNQLFQQTKYGRAFQVYSSVIDKLQEYAVESKTNEMEQLETAVRLNRALACVECEHSDIEMLELAEKDCTAVLATQSECVKALYRRAVARERLGKLQDAWMDAREMQRLEPSNPAAVDLAHRLQAACSDAQKQQSSHQERALVSELRRVSLTSNESVTTREFTGMTPAAEDAWLALQDEELKLQSAFRSAGKTKKSARRQGTRIKERAPPHIQQPQPNRGEISSKTNALWESLMQEEASSCAGVFKRVSAQTLSRSRHPTND